MKKKREKDTRKKIAVRATAEGFFGGARRRKGATFFVPEGVTGKWFEPTDPSLAAINAAALEEAENAKRAAADKARQDILDADKEAKEKKAQANAELQAAGRVADANAKNKIFGGFFGGNKGAETLPNAGAGQGQPSGQGGDADFV